MSTNTNCSKRWISVQTPRPFLCFNWLLNWSKCLALTGDSCVGSPNFVLLMLDNLTHEVLKYIFPSCFSLIAFCRNVLHTSAAHTWTHHQCCILESLGVSGLATDTLVQATRPRLIRPRPLSRSHTTDPTGHTFSARAISMLSLPPPRCCLWPFSCLVP